MTRARRVRSILSGMLALAVVATVVYAAAALLSPVPRLHIEQTISASLDGRWDAALALPAAGSTAALAAEGLPATAGGSDPRPIAGAAKLVLVSVVLGAEPLTAGETGPAITIDQAAVDRFRTLDSVGARTVAVQFGQSWTRRDLIAATLIGSGNNTAELLMESVFGGLDAYLASARSWLDERGLSNTVVVDSTGLDAGSLSTASDLAQLARLALETPVLAELLSARPDESSAGVPINDEANFVSELGTVGITRTYTDAAGVCVIMAVPVGDETIIVAMLGQPSYPETEAAAEALVESIREGVRAIEVVRAGEVVALARSQWGQSTELVATESISVSSTHVAGLGIRLEAASRSTIIPGADAGSIVVTAGGIEQVVRLDATSAITEPGVAWRFADPLTVLARWTG
jgi:serine-type D-Ala-D-Ala carboxypeptidase (penicillin-binding protein 5/6)